MPVSNETYTNQVLKIVVAQVCQTLGFTSVQTTPMDVMIDVLHNYIREMCKLTKDFAELYNRTEPTVEDVALAYREMKVNFGELKEYMDFIDPIACPIQVPKYPLPKESHLNFLKPGSQEVITRPTHIPEYLPPMQPPEEEEPVPIVLTTSEEVPIDEPLKEESSPTPTFFKKPEIVPSDAFRKFKFEEEGKPTREMSSVMMTTSGFISPAREGKLPDAKAPIIVPDKRPSPPPAPIVAPLPVTSMDNKFEEKSKKKHDEKKQKKKKEVINPVAGASASSKVLPPIPPHSIASSVPPSLPPVKPVAAVTPRKPGRPPKVRPEGVPPPKPKKPKDPDAKILKQLKKQMASGHLPQTSEHQLMEMLKKYKEAQKPSTSQPVATPSSQPFAPPQFGMSPKIEGKLPSEPEKSKLNIFKKFPGVSKPPEFGTPVVTPKVEPIAEETTPPPPMRKKEMESPMNMGIPKTPEFMPRTPDIKTSPWMKEEKKKKEKTEKKPKKPKASPIMPFFNQPNPMNSLGGMNLPFPPQPRFPFFPGLIPTGPGLIPNNPFMAGPSFGGNTMVPFGLPPVPNPAAVSGLFPGLGTMTRLREEPTPQVPIVEKPQCNVAPLLPAVPLDIPSTSQTSLSPILKLPPDTVAIPMDPVPSDLPPTEEPLATLNPDEFDTIDLTSPVSAKSDKKKDKEHKKEKKEKDKTKKKKKQKDKDKERGEKGEKEKIKKHKKEKKKEKERLDTVKMLSSNTDSVDASDSSMASVPKLTLKLGLGSGSRSSTPDVPKKASSKPGGSKKKDSDSFSDTFSDIGSSPRGNLGRESSPELAKISALVTHPPKKHQLSPKKRRQEEDEDRLMKSPTKQRKHSSPAPSMLQRSLDGDEEVQKVWICPACAQVDNGTPMIGCDGCDAWYHWVCVGIQVPPDDNEDWYCRACISRKQESHGEKKKKSKKKNKEKGEKI